MKTGNYVQGPSLPPGGRSSFRHCWSSCGKNTEMWTWQTWYLLGFLLINILQERYLVSASRLTSGKLLSRLFPQF